jgi:hypothetical protein
LKLFGFAAFELLTPSLNTRWNLIRELRQYGRTPKVTCAAYSNMMLGIESIVCGRMQEEIGHLAEKSVVRSALADRARS